MGESAHLHRPFFLPCFPRSISSRWGRQILSRIPASHTTTTTTPWLSEQQLHGHREWESICTQASALCVFIGWIIRLVHSAFILLLLCTAIRFVANTHPHLLPAEREFLHIRKGLFGWSAHNYKTTRHRFAGCSSWRLVFSLIPPFCYWSGRCSSSPSSLVSDIYILCTSMCCCCLLLLTLRRAIRLRNVQTGFDSSVIIQMHVCKPLTTLTPSPLPLQTLPTDHFQDSISQKISYIERMFLGVPAKWL